MDATAVQKHIELAHVPGSFERVFVIGCLDVRVTVYSQQVRAINLIDALFERHVLREGATLCVVGAGVAGLTAAAAAARRGVLVKLLEKNTEYLSLFADANANRWLHPRIYDWPYPGWDVEDAGLPLLNWRAGMVSSVREQMLEAWKVEGVSIRNSTLGEPEFGVKKVFVEYERELAVGWTRTQEGTKPLIGRTKPDCVVLAVGFGEEKCESETALEEESGYFRGDSLDHDQKGRRWLISGVGDGALTDLFRLSVRGFDHEKTLVAFLKKVGEGGIAERVLKIEDDALRLNQPSLLTDKFQEMGDLKILAAMKWEGRGVKLTLNSTTSDWLRPKASALNRLFASQLSLVRAFDLMPGNCGKPQAFMEGHRARRRVTLGGHEEIFDGVLRRHGVVPGLKRGFDKIWKVLEPRWETKRTLQESLDCTRARDWEEGKYGPEVRAEAYPGDRASSLFKRGVPTLTEWVTEGEEKARARIAGILEGFDMKRAYAGVRDGWVTMSAESVAAEMLCCEPLELTSVVSGVVSREERKELRAPVMDAFSIALPWTMRPWDPIRDKNGRLAVNAETPFEMSSYAAYSNQEGVNLTDLDASGSELISKGYLRVDGKGTLEDRLRCVARECIASFSNEAVGDMDTEESVAYMFGMMKADPMLYFALFRGAQLNSDLEFFDELVKRFKEEELKLEAAFARPSTVGRADLLRALTQLMKRFLYP